MHDLCHRYGLAVGEVCPPSDTTIPLEHPPTTSLAQKLEELRIYLRNEIIREYKIKEGADNLMKATSGKGNYLRDFSSFDKMLVHLEL